MDEYEQQAQQFLTDTGTLLEIVYSYTEPYFDDDKKSRDVYRFTLKNAKGQYSAKFGDSLQATAINALCKSRGSFTIEQAKMTGIYSKDNSKVMLAVRKLKPVKPTAYSILACLTKYDPGSYVDFCSEFGYDTGSSKAEKTYFAVQEEYNGLRRMFTPEQLEAMQEIN